MISLGKWQSGPSPGTPRAKEKIKNHVKHSQARGNLLAGCNTLVRLLRWIALVLQVEQRNSPLHMYCGYLARKQQKSTGSPDSTL